MAQTSTKDPFRVPPHDLQAEKSVLGGVLIDTSAIGIVAEFLKSPHFYAREHQIIFDGMIKLFEKQQPIDVITLKNQLQSDGEIKNAGGQEYLSELINSVPTSAYVEQYAHIIRAQYTKRKLIEVSSRSVERAFDSKGEIKELIDEIESEIFALAEEHQHRDFIHMKEILATSFERLEEFMKSGTHTRGVATGFDALDNKLSGLMPSNLVILAARPGVGKTTFALNIALNVAMKFKKSVGFFSLEMSKEELVDRLLVGQSDVDAWRLKTGRLTDDDTKRIVAAMGDLADAPIYIDDTPGVSILEMRTKARKLKAEKGLELLIVDYLQLADSGRRFDSRVQEVSFISLGLKNLARELQIPVLSLSQLSRAVEQRTDKKPQLADLRESGAIEQDADVVMFIYQDDDGGDLLDNNQRIMKISIAKHRNGPTGEIELLFRGDRVKFYTVDKTNEL
ncbi:replicative DNA helicase [soil metagenome]